MKNPKNAQECAMMLGEARADIMGLRAELKIERRHVAEASNRIAALTLQLNAQSRDTARLNYLESYHPEIAVRISRNAISTPPLRAAVDAEIEEITTLPKA
jgi:hypothetical protein